MDDTSRLIFGNNVRRAREALGISQERLADDAKLDRSYVGGIERGERNPSLSVILNLALALEVAPYQLFEAIGEKPSIIAVEANDGLALRFIYDQFDAEYSLPKATQPQYDELISLMREGLADTKRRSRSYAVSHSFLRAVQIWPSANPSDLWTFLINRAYLDRGNHPATNRRLNLEQSWKRTSGWALEQVLVEHYGSFLLTHGIALKISNKSEKSRFLVTIDDTRIVPDKADVLILYVLRGSARLLGVVHVKSSIAERRTDDVPMSQALIDAGYLSVFWTMDAKSFPSQHPTNLGEFGEARAAEISDKRRDFEEHGHFSACFSYNKNTQPTLDTKKVIARIFVCDFTNPDDRFARFLIDALRDRLGLEA